MAAGVGAATVVLTAVWLLNLVAVNNGPSPPVVVGDGQNPSSEIAVYSAFAAFLVYMAGIVLLYLEVLTR